MDKETYKYHLEIVTKYCMRCKNKGTGKDGPCPKCVYKSRFNKPLPPISFEEKKDGKIVDIESKDYRKLP